MIIDCDECAARGPACGDCVVSVLLGGPPEERTGDPDATDGPTARYVGEPDLLELDETERWAVRNLAAAGLVPPLRMVPLRAGLSTQSETHLTPRRREAG